MKVLEVATAWPGPSGIAVLADLGADVVRIEHPADDHRVFDPAGRLAPGFATGPTDGAGADRTAPGRSIGLDLSKPEGLDLLYEIARCADVFVIDLALERCAELGVAVDDLRLVSPEIVYVRVDVAAPRGPQSAVPQAMDVAFAVAAALFHREQTGEGAVVDVSALGTSRWSADHLTRGLEVVPLAVAPGRSRRVEADTEEVLLELGFRREHILRFKHDGVIA